MHLSAWTHTRSTMAVGTHFHTSLWKKSNRFFVMKDRREKKNIPLKNKCEESCETPHSVGLMLPYIITQSVCFLLGNSWAQFTPLFSLRTTTVVSLVRTTDFFQIRRTICSAVRSSWEKIMLSYEISVFYKRGEVNFNLEKIGSH